MAGVGPFEYRDQRRELSGDLAALEPAARRFLARAFAAGKIALVLARRNAGQRDAVAADDFSPRLAAVVLLVVVDSPVEHGERLAGASAGQRLYQVRLQRGDLERSRGGIGDDVHVLVAET